MRRAFAVISFVACAVLTAATMLPAAADSPAADTSPLSAAAAAAAAALMPNITVVPIAVCPSLPAAEVTLQFTSNPPLEFHNKSSVELGTVHIDTTFSHTRNETFTVGGLMQSKFAPKYSSSFNIVTFEEVPQICIALKSLEIVVNYAPEIYVASEFMPGTCRYRTTLQHEVRHVNTDIITFNEYLPQLKQATQEAANAMTTIGPIDEGQEMQAQDKLVATISEALVKKVREIEQVRFNRQQMIDTRAEYLRSSKLCEGQP